jgi:hypothetical protein
MGQALLKRPGCRHLSSACEDVPLDMTMPTEGLGSSSWATSRPPEADENHASAKRHDHRDCVKHGSVVPNGAVRAHDCSTTMPAEVIGSSAGGAAGSTVSSRRCGSSPTAAKH